MKKLFTIFSGALIVSLTALAVAADHVYTFRVKGVVKGLPGRGLAANEILVKHEPIPEYRDDTGKVVGMMAMTMPFYLKDVAAVEGLAVGDSVELVVEQQMKPRFSDTVVSVKKLP